MHSVSIDPRAQTRAIKMKSTEFYPEIFVPEPKKFATSQGRVPPYLI